MRTEIKMQDAAMAHPGRPMKKRTRSHLIGFLIMGAALTALGSGCGDQLSTLDRTCPCETGWTCCTSTNVCMPPGEACGTPLDPSTFPECSAGVILASGTEPSADAGALASLRSTGTLLGTFPAGGATMPFDYADSATASNGNLTFQGWIVDAGGTLSFHFKAWAEDGQSELPLQIVAYGPIELGPTTGTCFAPIVNGGPSSSNQGTFFPKVWGRYFVASYHDVTVANNGVTTIEAAGDSRYASAFVSLVPGD